MSTCLYTHPSCLRHETGQGHPERVARLEHIMDYLRGERFLELVWVESVAVEEATLALVHQPSMIRHVMHVISQVPQHGLAFLDSDTLVSAGSREATLCAVGASVMAVDAVMAGEATNAFCAVRPPGHHAEPERAMGFCLFNNVAIAAYHAIEAYGLSRVAILDFDVHHGNGTQAAVAHDKRILFMSTHQWPFYPYTGRRDEKGAGFVYNYPLPQGTDGDTFLSVWREGLAHVRAYQPQLMLLSAGFDAHEDDPLGGFRVSTQDFARLTMLFVEEAQKICQGRLVSMLEGGYNLTALAQSAAAHVGALMSHERVRG
ncbi:MAG: histone deacetylase family protein [Alphaproteobacteria bacterium GM7ARS4]|nr:histone deacetylase family protein [Alphaproteobacteria bacterium GM7ARS4]